MELKAGYKKTEIGVIPEDWDYETFNSIIFELKGGAPLAPKDFVKNGMLVLPKSGVTRGGYLKIDNNKQQYCTLDFANKHRYSWVDEQYTIIVLRDLVPSGPNIGLIVSIPDNKSYLLAQGVYGFRVFEDKAIPKFLIHLSNTNRYRKLMHSILVGSTQVHIRITTLKKTCIPLPPLPEQKAIAEVLSDTDELIQTLEKKIAKKRLIKQGAMQKLLTPKDDWEVKRLGEIGKCYRGVSYNGDTDLYSFDNENTYRLFRSNNIQESVIDYLNLQFVDCRKVSHSQQMISNDILICMANGSKKLVGKAASFIQKDCNRYTFGAFMGCFRVFSSEAVQDYIFYNFTSHSYRSFIDLLLSGSSINNLKPSDIESIEIPFPKQHEQTRIATILSDMDSEIEMLVNKLAKYKKLKQGLMQELLTGKTRLI